VDQLSTGGYSLISESPEVDSSVASSFRNATAFSAQAMLQTLFFLQEPCKIADFSHKVGHKAAYSSLTFSTVSSSNHRVAIFGFLHKHFTCSFKIGLLWDLLL
jgi:hypothetical protein